MLPPNAAILASGRQSEPGLCFVNTGILSSERKQSFIRDLKNKETLGTIWLIKAAVLFLLQDCSCTPRCQLWKPAWLWEAIFIIKNPEGQFQQQYAWREERCRFYLLQWGLVPSVILAGRCPLALGNSLCPLSVQSFSSKFTLGFVKDLGFGGLEIQHWSAWWVSQALS